MNGRMGAPVNSIMALRLSSPPRPSAASTRTVNARPDPAGSARRGVLATPAAVRSLALPEPTVEAFLRLDSAPDTIERVRNTAIGMSPLGTVATLRSTMESGRFTAVRRGIYLGLVATLLLIGLSLLVSTVEQLNERRRLLAVLVAFGTPRRTLAWSVLWQAAVPVVLGLALATGVGAGLGAALLSLADVPVRVNWPDLAAVCGTGAGMVLLVTALSLPVLGRLTRPGSLRAE